ncbi:MAG: hypothetical protein U0229_26335 [Anaeromyxobacter sp.]
MSDLEREERELRERLRALRVDPPDRGFSASLHARLAAAGPPAPAPWWRRLGELVAAPRWAWPAAGLATGVAVFLALTWLPGLRGGAGERSAHVTTLPATQVALVRLNLSTEVDVANARIWITLPRELSFWAEGEELPDRTLEWTQALRRGDNEIPVAVRGKAPGRYRIAVSALVGNEQVKDEVVLEVVDG